jgi:hypothetical protein
MGDPFLNYFALFLLAFVVAVLFYGIIAIHDVPAKIDDRSERSWRISHRSAADRGVAADKSGEMEDLRRRVAELEDRQRTGAR